MSAMNDVTCPKCKQHIGWQGKVTDRPPCPRCGHQVDRELLEADQKKVDDIMAEIRKEMEEDK